MMKLRDPNNQAEEIVYELLNAPHAVAYTLTQKYGIMNVPGAVFQAKKKGYDIDIDMVPRGNKWKRHITVGRWFLVDKEAALKLYNKTK